MANGPTAPVKAGAGLPPVFGSSPIASSTAGISGGGTSLGTELEQLLMADDIEPGSRPGYELAKIIYLLHPIGAKLVDSPITMAQSQPRNITVHNAPDEVVEAFEEQWEADQATEYIHDVGRLARIYGIATLVLGCDEVPANEKIDPERLPDLPIWFNALDPLNTAGSLVLSQTPATERFNTPVSVTSMGKQFHRTRFLVAMNERPIYLAWTTSAYGFVGRSIYQRALYPLKSFIRTMKADDMIQTKLGVLIAKQKSPGSVISEPMKLMARLKSWLLKSAQTGQVLQIGLEEEIATLNMMNVDGAGQYSRDNILRNIATAADMPAAIVNNETFVSGFGEGTEDAKNVAQYLEHIRQWLNPAYRWFDSIVQYRAWTPALFKSLQSKYPKSLSGRDYRDCFSEWRHNFRGSWPSLLQEPESERVKFDDVRFQAILAYLQTTLPYFDPYNKMIAIQWASDNMNENKLIIAHALELDYDELEGHFEDVEDRQSEEPEESEGLETGVAKKMGRFDAARFDPGAADRAVARLQTAILRLPDCSARREPRHAAGR